MKTTLSLKMNRSMMLDDPEKTSRLLAALKSTVPFKVVLTPEVVLHLRAKQVAAAVAAEQTVADRLWRH